MRRVFISAMIVLLSTLLMGAGPIVPMPRACPGSSGHDDFPCCVSGTVTLDGKPVVGAEVVVRSEKGKASDVTAYATNGDWAPTYGFLLNGPELRAAPGQVVTLTATYKDWTRTVELRVDYGEHRLDIELLDEPTEQY